MAESTSDESENYESEKEYDEQLRDETMTEEDNEDASPEIDNNEETNQNDSEEPENDEENQTDQDQEELPSDSNKEEDSNEQQEENQEQEDSENIQESEDSDDSNEESDEKEDFDEEELLEQSNDFSPFQTTGSVYTNRSFTVTTTGQTNDSVSLRFVFTGRTTLRDGEVFIQFRFPDEIEISDYNISGISGSYLAQERYGALGVPLRTENDQGNYNAGDIIIVGNTLYLRYQLSVSTIILGYIRSDHTFTLNITLRNSAFTLEGTQPYTFRTIGSQSQTPPVSYPQQATINLNLPESGNLSLSNVPDTLLFQTTEIGMADYVYLASNPNHVVNIEDTRIFNDNWTLTAQSLGPFTTSSNSAAPLIIGTLDGNNFQTLDDSVIIANSAGNWGDPININLNSLPNRQFVVAVDEPHDILSTETYSTTIEWTLTDAP